MFTCNSSDFFKIRNIQSGIANGFQINGLGFFINMLFKTFGIITICKSRFNT